MKDIFKGITEEEKGQAMGLAINGYNHLSNSHLCTMRVNKKLIMLPYEDVLELSYGLMKELNES